MIRLFGKGHERHSGKFQFMLFSRVYLRIWYENGPKYHPAIASISSYFKIFFLKITRVMQKWLFFPSIVEFSFIHMWPFPNNRFYYFTYKINIRILIRQKDHINIVQSTTLSWYSYLLPFPYTTSAKFYPLHQDFMVLNLSVDTIAG